MDPEERQQQRLAELLRLFPAAPAEHACRRLGTLAEDPWIRAQLDQRLAAGWEPVAAVDDVAHLVPGRIFDRLLEAVGPAASILDFGCGLGSLRNFGRTYADIPNPVVAVDRGAPPPALPPSARFVRSDLHAFAWDGQPFDLVLALHVLEQLPDAPVVLRKLRSLLRPGAFAYLAFPETRFLHSAVKHVFKGADYDEQQSFTFETFDALVERAGFRRLAWSTWPSYFRIHYGHVPLPGGTNLGELLDRVAAQMDRANGTLAHGAYGYALVYEACPA